MEGSSGSCEGLRVRIVGFLCERPRVLFVSEFVVFVGLRGGEGSGMDGRGSVRVKGGCKWSSGLVGAAAAIGARCLGSKKWAARVWRFWGKGCQLGFLERKTVEGFTIRFRGWNKVWVV